MTDIQWEEPPTRAGRTGYYTDWSVVADQLRARPGQWAKIKSESTDAALATRIKKGVTKAFEPAGSFESRTVFARTTEDGKALRDIYARYVGAES